MASSDAVPRRRFVTILARLLLGLWVIGIVAGIARFLQPKKSHSHRKDEVVIPAREIGDMQIGQVMLVPHSAEPIHLVKLGDEEFLALSAICTHLRCILNFDADSQMFVCPCHEGQFDLNGNVLAGLPTAPLPRYRTAYRFGEVIIQRA